MTVTVGLLRFVFHRLSFELKYRIDPPQPKHTKPTRKNAKLVTGDWNHQGVCQLSPDCTSEFWAQTGGYPDQNLRSWSAAVSPGLVILLHETDMHLKPTLAFASRTMWVVVLRGEHKACKQCLMFQILKDLKEPNLESEQWECCWKSLQGGISTVRTVWKDLMNVQNCRKWPKSQKHRPKITKSDCKEWVL